MSGAGRNQRFGGGYDVHMPLFGLEMKVECKHRAVGFQTLYRWLAPVDVLIVRCDHGEPLVVMPLTRLLQLAKGNEK